MEINDLVENAKSIADEYNLKLLEIDRTDNIVNMKVFIDNELFIQIYGNTTKDKLNLALVFKRRRLYGYDSEGGKYHCHPFDDPDKHIFVDNKKPIREFVIESMEFLEKNDLL